MFAVICIVILLVCFSAWGESTFLASQTAIIAGLVLFFERSTKQTFLFIISYIALCIILMEGYTPLNVLWSMQVLNVPLICVGKVSVLQRN
jgi:mannose-P-dolichol utilization defect protein 1